jgi:hypothetical protein
LELIYPGIAVGLHRVYEHPIVPGKFFDRRALMMEIEKARAAIEQQPCSPKPGRQPLGVVGQGRLD